MYINYADPKKYIQMSMTELMSDDIDLNKIQNRMIVVGLDAAGLSVLKYTPHGLTTDQNITAQALDTLLTGKYLLRTKIKNINRNSHKRVSFFGAIF